DQPQHRAPWRGCRRMVIVNYLTRHGAFGYFARHSARSAFMKATTPSDAKNNTKITSPQPLMLTFVAKAPPNPTNMQKPATSNQTLRESPHTRGTDGTAGLLS